MSKEILKERKDALENEFFKRQNEEALEGLRALKAVEEAKAALSRASGLTDDAALDALTEVGITAETITAMSLVPLVAVAWADGKLDDSERSAILEAFQSKASEANRDLLDAWLAKPPDPSLLDAWKLYIEAVLNELDAEARETLRSQLLGGAKEVAEAAGGFLGLGNKISASEAAVLAELEACFQRT